MDCCKTWFGFLSAEIIRRCIESCKQDCPACKDGLLSPLLHFHIQYSLREKLDHYYYKIVQELNIADLFDRFILQFGWLSLNRDEFISIGQYFTRFSTPEALFYGKYITKENDLGIYGSSTCSDQIEKTSPEKAIKAKKRKKNTISQDDISRSSAQNY